MKNKALNPTMNCGAKYISLYAKPYFVVLVSAAVLLALWCSPGWSVGESSRGTVSSSGIGNPVGRATVPQSGIQSGLVRSPNPVDNSGSMGNMIITGNVQAGKHFRGPVPYQSTTDFRAPLGSASLDSFLRYSAGSEDDGGYTEAYRPFYSPTGTVSTIRPGQSTADLSWPTSTKLRTNAELPWNGRPGDDLAVQDAPGTQNPPAGRGGDSLDLLPLSPRPMARTPEELEKLISGELGRAAAARSLSLPLVPREGMEDRRGTKDAAQRAESPTSAQYREQMEQLQREVERISNEAAELRQSLQAPSAEASRGMRDPRLRGDRLAPAEAGGQGTMENPPPLPVARQEQGGQPDRVSRPSLQSFDPAQDGDVRGQFNKRLSPREARAKLDSLLASASQQRPTPAASRSRSEPAGAPELSQGTLRFDKAGAGSVEELPGTRSLVRRMDGGPDRDQQLVTRGTTDERRATSDETRATNDERQPTSLTALQEVNKLSAQELSAEAKRVLGGHQDYNTYSANKFEQYFKAGQEYLKQGKYYRAVDAYTLASIYKPGPAGSLGKREAVALAYAGRSLALFAAGEYMSSALFLGRALQTDQFPIFSFQISIPADKLDSRIADAEECLRLCRKAGYQTGGVGELQFLLGYIYLRTGRLPEAKKAIDEACEKLPDAPAVIALKRAIDSAAAGSQPAIK
jgi:tetratricopeptide (TPR) repeat protein